MRKSYGTTANAELVETARLVKAFRRLARVGGLRRSLYHALDMSGAVSREDVASVRVALRLP